MSDVAEREAINASLGRIPGTGPVLVGDPPHWVIPAGLEPAVVRTLVAIDPRRDTKHAIACRETLAVAWVDDDRRGVTVQNDHGEYVSLHPSEFEVIDFASELSPETKGAKS